MNILFVHEIDWFRKVVFELHTMAELLSLRGHNVFAIDYESMWTRDKCFDFVSRTEFVNIPRYYPEADVILCRPSFVKIPVISRLSAGLSYYYLLSKILKYCNIDIIILYSVPTNGLQTIRLAKHNGIPVIFRSIDTLHALVPVKLLSLATKLIERQIYRSSDLILAINHKLCEYTKNMGAKNVALLPLGIDDNLFKPNGNEEEGLIVFVGTLPHFSGVDNFIRMFPQILTQVPIAKFLIVGDGEQRPYLESIINQLKLEKCVVITGFKDMKEVPKYINRASVCVSTFPTTRATRDIYPTKVMQYMICGKPVVSTPLDGIKDMIDGERQGMLYDTGVDRVVELLKSKALRRQIGYNAYRFATATHGYDNIISQLESHLEGLKK